MAIKAVVKTIYGKDVELYLRINNIDVSNHGVESIALIRGYISKEAFDSGNHYAYQESINFDADVSSNLWEQAYIAFCTLKNIENKQV